ncbi:hypothetical protein [Lancefieldella rimae]|uniref:hypothetical protein n=2 Tax=Atopobiaceae TaxID=1643824 RepID=UPI0018DCC6CF
MFMLAALPHRNRHANFNGPIIEKFDDGYRVVYKVVDDAPEQQGVMGALSKALFLVDGLERFGHRFDSFVEIVERNSVVPPSV